MPLEIRAIIKRSHLGLNDLGAGVLDARGQRLRLVRRQVDAGLGLRQVLQPITTASDIYTFYPNLFLVIHIAVSLSSEAGAWCAVSMELNWRMSVTAAHLGAAQWPGPVSTRTFCMHELGDHHRPTASARACRCAQTAHEADSNRLSD